MEVIFVFNLITTLLVGWFCKKSCGQTLIHFIVDSSRAGFQTGPREYTLYNNNLYLYQITCIAAVGESLNSTLLLFRDNERIYTSTFRDSLGIKMDKHRPRAGNYTCQLSVDLFNSSSDSRLAQLSYVMESHLVIKRTSSNLIAASNVGTTGYTGESVNLVCYGRFRYVYVFNGRKMMSDNPVTHTNRRQGQKTFIISFNRSRILCEYNDRGRTELLDPITRILPNLEVTLSPYNFTTNSVLNFTCESTPPRLLYWSVIGNSGVIFDISSLHPAFIVTTSVTIRQWPGRSTLDIVESIPGGNGITTIFCSTYDTRAPIIASAHLVPVENIQPTTERFVKETQQTTRKCSCAQDVTTAASTEIFTKGTLQKITNFPASYFEYHGSTTQRYNLTRIGMNVAESGTIFIAAIFLQFVVIVILTAIIGYMRLSLLRRNSPSVSDESGVIDKGVPTGTVMHDNPAYIPTSSEASEESHYEDDDEEQYANV